MRHTPYIDPRTIHISSLCCVWCGRESVRLRLPQTLLILDLVTVFLAGAGPRLVRVSSKSFIRLNDYDPLTDGDAKGEVTTIRRVNSHAQFITKTKST